MRHTNGRKGCFEAKTGPPGVLGDSCEAISYVDWQPELHEQRPHHTTHGSSRLGQSDSERSNNSFGRRSVPGHLWSSAHAGTYEHLGGSRSFGVTGRTGACLHYARTSKIRTLRGPLRALYQNTCCNTAWASGQNLLECASGPPSRPHKSQNGEGLELPLAAIHVVSSCCRTSLAQLRRASSGARSELPDGPASGQKGRQTQDQKFSSCFANP